MKSEELQLLFPKYNNKKKEERKGVSLNTKSLITVDITEHIKAKMGKTLKTLPGIIFKTCYEGLFFPFCHYFRRFTETAAQKKLSCKS